LLNKSSRPSARCLTSGKPPANKILRLDGSSPSCPDTGQEGLSDVDGRN
jgi:hypothetical protein